jgi:formate hydrogenlyase subunit 3/multisubunit Na+/H+ antiporter MnhD subunit
MLLGIGTGTVIGVLGGVFHMLNHAIYKSCLFLGAGAVERETKTMALDKLGGLVKVMPWTFGCMLIASLAIAGIPPLNGFASKWLVYQSCVAGGYPLFLVAALFGSVLTLASFVKVLHSVFWGPLPERYRKASDGGISMGLPLVSLAGLCVVFGLLAAFPLDQWIGPVVGLEPGTATSGATALHGAPETYLTVAQMREGAEASTRFEQASFRPLVLTALLLVGTLLGLIVAFIGNMQWRRTRGVFIGGEPLNPVTNTFPGTEFYRTVRELPFIRGMLTAGEKGDTDVYDAGARIGGRVIAGLRRIHTGVITDYLFWCFLGMVVLLVAMIWR